MKTTLYTLTLVCLSSFLFMGGCIKNITTIKFGYNSEVTFTTDSLASTGSQIFGSSVDTSELNSEIQKNGTSLDLIDEVKLKSVEVAFTNPDSTKNFNKIESVELWLSANGLPAIKVASKNPVADGLSLIQLDVNSNEDLLNYIKSTTFTYEVKGVNSEPLLPVELKVNTTFDVKASSKAE